MADSVPSREPDTHNGLGVASEAQGMKVDVAIVGGGPGGLAAAAAILTARPDLRVAVFERSTLRPRGASVMVHPNGLSALEAIDPALVEAAMAIDSRLDTFRRYAKDGTLLSLKGGDDSPAEYIRRVGGRVSMCSWHELQAALARALPPGVLHEGCALEGVKEEEGEGGVTLTFLDGKPPVTAAVVAGADSCQSAVRKHTIGDGPPRFIGTAIWRAVMPAPDFWPKEGGAFVSYGMPPAVLLGTSLHDGSVAWQAFAPWPESRLGEIGGVGALYTQDPLARREQGEARRARALEAFNGFCSDVVSLISEADVLALTEHPQWYRDPEDCKVWGRGRITLLGDAAHLSTPVLAQGTSQAFEDALELGRAIGEHGPCPEALRAYEAARQPMMEHIHTTSVRLFQEFNAGGPPPQDHIENEELGVWRPLPPLPRPSPTAAAS